MKITEVTDDVVVEDTSVIDDCVKNIGDFLSKEGTLKETSALFAAKTSDEDRVSLTRSLSCVQKYVQVPPLSNKNIKSTQEASQKRNEGNEQFKKKKFDTALKLYSKSIQFAPVDDADSSLALAHANRSAVLFHLKRYEDCVSDIELALENGYPKETCYKLYDRQARCLKELKRHFETGQVYEKLRESLEHAQIDEGTREKWRKEVEKAMIVWTGNCMKGKIHSGSGNEVKHFANKPTPRLGANPNTQFPALSRRCDVSYSDNSGRSISATEDIDTGEVLMVERPFASVLLPEHYQTHCHVCYVRCDVMITCSGCTQARYCSVKCRNLADATFHKYECGVLESIHSSALGKFGHLALRAITCKGPDFYKGFRENEKKQPPSADPRLLGFSENGTYQWDSYQTIFNLVGHSELRKPGDLFRRTVGAVFLLHCLQQSEFFQGIAEVDCSDFENYIGSLLLRHLQSFPCNAHEISELQLDPNYVAESLGVEIGAGIYATLSLFNHSCDPMATRHFYGDTCVVRAIRPGKRSEEISDNYGAVFAVQDRSERQEKLRSQYYFDCACTACTLEWPLYLEIPHETPNFICSNCRYDIGPKTVDSVKCTHCSSVVDVKQKQLALTLATEKYHNGLKKLLLRHIEESVTYFVKALNLFHETVALTWRDVNNCQEGLKQCFSILGNCHELPPSPED